MEAKENVRIRDKMNPYLRQRISDRNYPSYFFPDPKQEAIYVYRDLVMEMLQQIDTATDTV